MTKKKLDVPTRQTNPTVTYIVHLWYGLTTIRKKDNPRETFKLMIVSTYRACDAIDHYVSLLAFRREFEGHVPTFVSNNNCLKFVMLRVPPPCCSITRSVAPKAENKT
jgi:hypothetical protein